MFGSRQEHKKRFQHTWNQAWQAHASDPDVDDRRGSAHAQLKKNVGDRYGLLDSLDRDLGAAMLATVRQVPGIRSDTYKIRFEHTPLDTVPQRLDGKSASTRTANYILSVDVPLSGEGVQRQDMNLALTMPMSDAEKGYLRFLSQASQQRGENSLYERVKELTRLGMRHEDQARFAREHIDPHEHRLLKELRTVQKVATQNGLRATQYFMHMAALNNTGDFAKTKDARFLTQIKGVWSPDAVAVSLKETDRSSNGYFSQYPKIGEDDHDQLKQLLAQDQPWYKNNIDELDWGILLRDFAQFGNARINRQEFSTSTQKAAEATESITHQLYEALGGEDTEAAFTNKLDYVGDQLEITDLLEPYKHAYFSDDKIPVSNCRYGRIHQGKLDFEELNPSADEWATQYYTDLAKTLLSGVAGEKKGYYEFDDFARQGPLYDEVSLIPASKKFAYRSSGKSSRELP